MVSFLDGLPFVFWKNMLITLVDLSTLNANGIEVVVYFYQAIRTSSFEGSFPFFRCPLSRSQSSVDVFGLMIKTSVK